MRPLSPLKFIKGSLLKTFPVTVTVCLGVAILYFMGMFVQQLDGQIEAGILTPIKNMSLVNSGKSGMKPEDIATLSTAADPSGTFYAQSADVMFHNVVGTSGTLLVLAEQENVEKLMQAMKLRLVEGRMPGKPMEAVIHERLAANHGLSVGSIVPKGHKGWRTDRDVAIVGLLEGESMLSLGIQESKFLTPETPYVSMVILSEDEQLSKTNAFLEEHFADRYDLTTYGLVKNLLRTVQGSMTAMKTFVGVILVFVLSVFLANITGIQYALRKKELELLHAIGYTRKYMIRKALVEMSCSGLIGYLCGILLAVTLCWVINVYAWNDKGLPLPLFSPGVALTLLLVPAAVTLFSMIAPVRLTRFRDLA